MKTELVNMKFLNMMFGVVLFVGAGLAHAAGPTCFNIEVSGGATPSVELGSASPSLIAVCGTAATVYAWSVDTNVLGCTGKVCVVPAADLNAEGVYNVKVKAKDAAGAWGVESPPMQITVTPISAFCDPTYGTVELIDPGVPASGNKITLTSNCNPGANRSTKVGGYSWTRALPNSNSFANIPQAEVVGSIYTDATIAVKLPAAGTRFNVSNTVAANGQVNGDANSVQFSGALPSCTLELVNATGAIRLGESVALKAICNNAASVDWHAKTVSPVLDIPIPVPAGGIVSPKVDTNYYVVGHNTYGSSGSNAVAVTVGAAAVSGRSDCFSIMPATANIAPNTAISFTANCNNGPATAGYSWQVKQGATGTPATVAGCSTGSSCNALGSNFSTAGIYYVTVTNNNGQGVGAAATATVTVSTTPAASNCTGITPATTTIAPNTATSFTASCNNNPAAAGYLWKVKQGAAGTPATVAGCTGVSCNVPGTKFGTAATYYVTVTNNNGQGAGAAAQATVTATSGYVPVVKCPPLTITEKAFDFINPGGSQHLKMNRGQAIAFKFTTDASGKAGTIETAISGAGLDVYRYMVVSETKCDFSYVPYDTRTGCGGNGNIKYTTGAKQAFYCPLKPNTTYYANIRNENAALSTRGNDTCPVGQNCGFVGAIY